MVRAECDRKSCRASVGAPLLLASKQKQTEHVCTVMMLTAKGSPPAHDSPAVLASVAGSVHTAPWCLKSGKTLPADYTTTFNTYSRGETCRNMAKQQQTTTVLRMMICCAAWKPDKPSGNETGARLEIMLTADQHAHHKHINPANWLLQNPVPKPIPVPCPFPAQKRSAPSRFSTGCCNLRSQSPSTAAQSTC